MHVRLFSRGGGHCCHGTLPCTWSRLTGLIMYGLHKTWVSVPNLPCTRPCSSGAVCLPSALYRSRHVLCVRLGVHCYDLGASPAASHLHARRCKDLAEWLRPGPIVTNVQSSQPR